MFTWLLELFKIPETRDLTNTEDIDDIQTTVLHRNIIKKKHFLYKLFQEHYSIFKKNIEDIPDGLKIELGSGGGFLKEVINDVVTSASFGLFTGIEKLLSPFSNTLGSFMTIVLKKSK